MVFEDLNEYKGKNSCYAVCNEHISTWRTILQDVSVESAGAVCSGGEVSFFGILPCVKDKLVLIDHSYSSMYYALGKYYLVEKLGAAEAFKLLVTSNERALEPFFEEANADLPTHKSPYSYWDGSTRIYEDITQEGVEHFEAAKDKISFLHGDLNDLVERGPFDLVYLSNALEYTGRNGSNFEVEKMVKPGGLIAHCHGVGYRQLEHFEVVSKVEHEYNENYGLNWIYTLCKAPE